MSFTPPMPLRRNGAANVGGARSAARSSGSGCRPRVRNVGGARTGALLNEKS